MALLESSDLHDVIIAAITIIPACIAAYMSNKVANLVKTNSGKTIGEHVEQNTTRNIRIDSGNPNGKERRKVT